MFINVGAFGPDGQRVPTKKALKELLATNPAGVTFDRTSAFDTVGTIKGDEIPLDSRLTVVGPDPFWRRSWYASVRVVDGTPRVT
jgi:hypothetical protein